MWPTILTLVMYPVLIVVYTRLAKQEERLVRNEFGEAYDRYAQRVPAFIPHFRKGFFHQIGSNER
jgi:protein-S-isoprenylcysteine O-methyltransferase Ste14